MRDVGIGVIGTGFARRVQIPAFLACEGARIASVSSSSIENAQAAADEFGIGHFSPEWRDTVLHPEVDLVCITTPPVLHREMTMFAIENGKHILCEKPMAMGLGEAEEMLAAAAETPLLALIDHELRFQPGRQLAFRSLREGRIGKVRHAKGIFQAPHRGDPDAPWNWWADEKAGGGALGAIASHIIDSFNWFLDTEASDVFCQLQTHIKTRRDSSGTAKRVTSDDEATMLLRFHDSGLTADATGLVSVSMTEYPKYKNQLEFYGEKGAISIDHVGRVFLADADQGEWTEMEVSLGENIPGVPDTGFARGFLAFAPKLVAAIRNGDRDIENAATFLDGVKVQKVLDAARRSNVSGCSVSIQQSI